MFLLVDCILHQDVKGTLYSFQKFCYLQMFMGRPVRVARSKRFLKKETKMTDQTEDVATPLNSNSEESGEDVGI